MSPRFPSAAAITVIGDGLAGTVLALSLAARGASVRLIGAGDDAMATGLSYGALPRGRPSGAWRRLERLHGPLGWRASGLVFHDGRPGLPHRLAGLSQRLPLPLARVDTPTWCSARRRALAAAGVRHLSGCVCALEPALQGSWRLKLAPSGGAESELTAKTVGLAAGAGCRALSPGLPRRLRHSWAGVLLLAAGAPANPWLDQARRGRIVQPRHWRRPAVEAGSADIREPVWVVDAGLAPWGEGMVVGQISWIPPAGPEGERSPSLSPPDPHWMEERLREGLEQLDPELASLDAPYRQVPVSFCSDGQPLVGPVAGAPGLWSFAGFSAAFSRVPSEAEALADRLLAAAGDPGQ
ncbi:MAG: FAD-dependent oxidoreductase [Cyanobacteriota bacterium]